MNFFDFRAMNEQVCEMYAQSCGQWLSAMNTAQNAMSSWTVPASVEPKPSMTTSPVLASPRLAAPPPAQRRPRPDEEFVVSETRRQLLKSTTSLTKIATAMEAFYARINETLLYVRMLEAHAALTRQMLQMASASQSFVAACANTLQPQRRTALSPAPLPFFANPFHSVDSAAKLSEAALATVPVMAFIAGMSSAYQDLMPNSLMPSPAPRSTALNRNRSRGEMLIYFQVRERSFVRTRVSADR